MRGAVMVLCALVAAPGMIQARQAVSDPRAAGLGDAFGALARGAAAVAYNPATLGLATPARVHLMLPAGRLGYGASPISLRDIDRYGGRVVPPEVKQEWLAAIPVNGAFQGTIHADARVAGASVDRVAIIAGAVGGATMELPRAAAELLLFGNTGERDDFSGGSGRFFAVSFLSVSAAQPVSRQADGVIAVGGSLRYVRGHAFGALWELSGEVDGHSGHTDLRFPAVTVDAGGHRGIGLDLGVVWQRPGLTLGASVSDLVNTFEWDAGEARLRDGRALLSEEEIAVEFDDRPLDDPRLPSTLVAAAEERLVEAVFRPVVRLSSARRWSRATLTADLVYRAGGAASLRSGPPAQVSVGIEHRSWSFLRLRAGASLSGDGPGGAVGAGVILGPVEVDAGFGRRAEATGAASLLALGIGVSW